MIVLYFYLGLAFTWSVYNAIINVPAYCKINTTVGPTEKTMIYITSIIFGTLIAPYSFYKKVLYKGGNKK